jgi:hypothetical protein
MSDRVRHRSRRGWLGLAAAVMKNDWRRIFAFE